MVSEDKWFSYGGGLLWFGGHSEQFSNGHFRYYRPCGDHGGDFTYTVLGYHRSPKVHVERNNTNVDVRTPSWMYYILTSL